VLLVKYCSGDEIKDDEMGGTCGTCGGRGRGGSNAHRIFSDKAEKGNHLKHLGIDGRKWSRDRPMYV